MNGIDCPFKDKGGYKIEVTLRNYVHMYVHTVRR